MSSARPGSTRSSSGCGPPARRASVGVSHHILGVDPNANNLRVFNLIDLDPIFGELIAHPVADAIAAQFLGPNYIISNFTANIARPGSESMIIHSDQAAVAPELWLSPWSINIIWCLCNVRGENGGTLYVPGSQHYTTAAELPAALAEQLVPFEAPAGSIVAMEGRVWHTSGANITANEDRPYLLATTRSPSRGRSGTFQPASAPRCSVRSLPRCDTD